MSSAYAVSNEHQDGGTSLLQCDESASARRRLLLEMQRPSGDELTRLDALEKLRELDGVSAAPSPGWRPTPAQAARRDLQHAKVARALQLEKVATGKTYMHQKNIERLKDAARAEKQAKFRADVLEAYQRDDADWGQVIGKREARSHVQAAAAAAAAQATTAADDRGARDEDGDRIDDEGDPSDEEFEFYRYSFSATCLRC